MVRNRQGTKRAAFSGLRPSLPILVPILATLATAHGRALAGDLFSLDGFADFSLVRPSDQRDWLEGGLGKTRFGSDASAGAKVQLTEVAADVRLKPDNDLLAFASLRYEPKQK